MTNREINQLIIAAIVDVLIVWYLLSKIWNGNDKAVIFIILFYPLVIVINAAAWMITGSKAFKVTTFALLILFLPVLLICGSY